MSEKTKAAKAAVRDAFLYSNAASEADEPCYLGHFGCANVEGGTCAAEKISQAWGLAKEAAGHDFDSYDSLEDWANEPEPDRWAIVTLWERERGALDSYLPRNYRVVATRPDPYHQRIQALIGGYDNHGWTLDGYVLPRLGSGLFAGIEITEKEAKEF